MKKNYVNPCMRVHAIHSSHILAGSGVTYGGSNSQTGAPASAESKTDNLWGWGDDDK